jgi:hypothetical protein
MKKTAALEEPSDSIAAAILKTNLIDCVRSRGTTIYGTLDLRERNSESCLAASASRVSQPCQQAQHDLFYFFD